jgi:hypothetical protein
LPSFASSASSGAALSDTGQFDEARTVVASELALLAKEGKPTTTYAAALFNQGTIEVNAHHCEAARAPLERAIAMYKDLDPADKDDVAASRALITDCK